jgi:hypothetical protein
MRIVIGALAFLFLLVGEASAAEWPSWFQFPGVHPNHPWSGPPRTGCCDDNVLCPQLAPWVLQPSQCRQPWCGPCGWNIFPRKTGELQIFPPLPYGQRAFGAVAAPAATAPPLSGAGASAAPGLPALPGH